MYPDTDSVNTILDDSQNPHPTDSTTGVSPDTVSPPTLLGVELTGVDNTDSESALDADQHKLLLNNDDPSTTVELQEIKKTL